VCSNQSELQKPSHTDRVLVPETVSRPSVYPTHARSLVASPHMGAALVHTIFLVVLWPLLSSPSTNLSVSSSSVDLRAHRRKEWHPQRSCVSWWTSRSGTAALRGPPSTTAATTTTLLVAYILYSRCRVPLPPRFTSHAAVDALGTDLVLLLLSFAKHGSVPPTCTPSMWCTSRPMPPARTSTTSTMRLHLHRRHSNARQPGR
jgi:hypothetical protein